MAHSTKKLKRMIERQKERIALATIALEQAKDAGDAKEVSKLANSLRSHRANIQRWQKTINRREDTSLSAIERSAKPASHWRKTNHSKAEKRASRSDREGAWKLKEAQRKHDIMREVRAKQQSYQRAAGIPNLDWSGTSRA